MAKHTHTTPKRMPEGTPGAAGRRSLVGAMTVLLLAPAAAAEPMPDAGLLRLCAAFHDATRSAKTPGADDDAWEAWLARSWEISDAIEVMTPITSAGRLAKARVALELMDRASDQGNDPERFATIVLREMVGDAA